MKRVAWMVFLSGAWTGLGACSVSIEELCLERLPVVESEVAQALASLSMPAIEGRQLASLAAPGGRDKERWAAWAESHLKATQSYLDVVQEEPGFSRARKPLTEVANGWVSFLGYVQQGQVERMRNALRVIQEKGTEAKRIACR